jgi:hypothetical protein
MSTPEDWTEHRPSTGPASTQHEAARRRLKRRIIIWYAVAAAGVVASLISYATTAPGGNYVVFAGVVFVGLTSAKRNWDVLLRLRRQSIRPPDTG